MHRKESLLMSTASTIFLIFFIALALLVLAIWATLLVLLASLIVSARKVLQPAACGIPPQTHRRCR